MFARLIAALLIGFAAANVHAAQIVVANVAPASLATAGVNFAIDGRLTADLLDYREFVRYDSARGAHRVRFDIAGAASVEVEVQITADTQTVLLALHGGDGAPYVVATHDDNAIAVTLGQDVAGALLRHHYAGGAAAAGGTVSEYECVAETDVVAAGQVQRSGETAYTALADGVESCTVRFRHPAFSAIEVETESEGANLHVFLVGDGERAPYEVLTFNNGRLAANGPVDFSPNPGTPGIASPSSLLDSPTFWFDAERPLQGVSLFEMPETGAVYGTWFGFEQDGRASWLALEGGAVYAGTRRDLRISELTRGPDGLQINGVGSGTLLYIDCNNAELRMFLRNAELRTLRIKRSRPVQVCFALDERGT